MGALKMVNVVILCALSLGLHGLTVNGDNSIEKRLSVSEESDPETKYLREKLEEEDEPLANWGPTVKDKALSSLVIFGTAITTITVSLVSYILVGAVSSKSMSICPAIFIILLWILLLSVVCLNVDDVFEYVIDEAFKKDIMVVAKYAVLPILSVSLVIFVSFILGVLIAMKCGNCSECGHKERCQNTSPVSCCCCCYGESNKCATCRNGGPSNACKCGSDAECKKRRHLLRIACASFFSFQITFHFIIFIGFVLLYFLKRL